MIIVGLTGGIASGKSTTAALIRDRGIPVHDADAAVHELMAAGGAAVTAVTAAFGSDILSSDGSIDRRRLGAAVFSDPALRRRLESIIHPLVATHRDRFLDAHRRSGTPMVVLDIPLLFETGGEALCDYVILCRVAPDEQRRRALARDGMTDRKLDAIIDSQMSLVDKSRLADAVIETDHGIDAARDALAAILDGPLRDLMTGSGKSTGKDKPGTDKAGKDRADA